MNKWERRKSRAGPYTEHDRGTIPIICCVVAERSPIIIWGAVHLFVRTVLYKNTVGAGREGRAVNRVTQALNGQERVGAKK